jgi:hypothetical protein
MLWSALQFRVLEQRLVELAAPQSGDLGLEGFVATSAGETEQEEPWLHQLRHDVVRTSPDDTNGISFRRRRRKLSYHA